MDEFPMIAEQETIMAGSEQTRKPAALAVLLWATVLMAPLVWAGVFTTQSDAAAGANTATKNVSALKRPITPASITCGQTITADTKLDADLSCPPETEIGIIIGVSNIILDLGGHVLSGYAPAGKVNRGIVADDVSGVTIKNGTVEEFSKGVDVFNSRGVVVENLSVRNLRSTDPAYFIAGINIFGSSAVVVKNSQFEFAPLVFHKEAIDVYASEVTVSNIVVRGGGVGVNFSFANTCDPVHSPNTGEVLNSRFVDARHGVLVACSTSARISGNDIDCPSGPGWCEGIRSYGPFAGAVTGIRAEGNTIRNAFSGINWEGVIQSSATNNTITASTGWGIALRQTQGEDGGPIYPPTGNAISDNRVWGNATDLFDDLTGQGNTWVRNTCATKQGDVIPACSAPAIIANPSDQSVVAGQTASFSAAATYAGWQPNFTPTVQWQASTDGGSTWAFMTWATLPTCSFTAAIADSGKQYRAVFTSSNGTATTAAATLTVASSSSAPTVTAHPSDQVASDGQTASFSAAARGTPTPKVQWQVTTNQGSTWVDIVTGATLPTYSLTTATTDSGKRYRAVFTNSVGAAMTIAAELAVNPRAAGTDDLHLNPGGAANAATIGGSGATKAGYAIGTVIEGSAPYSTAVFSYAPNGIVLSESGVPASPPTRSARIFIDYRVGAVAIPGRSDSGLMDINTGLALVNCGPNTANVTYALHDYAGAIIATGHGTIDSKAHYALFIDQLKDIAPDFNLPSAFSTATQFASLEISSDQPLSIVALRQVTNQRREVLFTTTPTADLTLPSSRDPVYFAQFADGGGYTTSLVLMNSSSANETGTFQILDDDGFPLFVKEAGGPTGSSFRYQILPGGFLRFQTDGYSSKSRIGWVRLIPDSGTSRPVGAAVFSYNPEGVLVSESGVPATGSTTHARIYVDLSDGHNTGLAIANVMEANATFNVQAFQIDGVTGVGTAMGPLTLAGGGHIAKFADQLIAGLPSGFAGVLDISSTTPFAALTLRSLYNERHDFLFTIFPTADQNRPAPSPIVFPQIADGGGFVTEFILLSAGAASNARLNFYDEAGKALLARK